MHTTHRAIVFATSVILVVAACGSESTSEADPTTTAAAERATAQGPVADVEPDPEDDAPAVEQADEATIAIAQALVHDPADLPGWEAAGEGEPFADEGVARSDCLPDELDLLPRLPIGAMASRPFLKYPDAEIYIQSWSAVFASPELAGDYLETLASDEYLECQRSSVEEAFGVPVSDITTEADPDQIGYEGLQHVQLLQADDSRAFHRQLTFQHGNAILTVIVQSDGGTVDDWVVAGAQEADARRLAVDRATSLMEQMAPG